MVFNDALVAPWLMLSDVEGCVTGTVVSVLANAVVCWVVVDNGVDTENK